MQLRTRPLRTIMTIGAATALGAAGVKYAGRTVVNKIHDKALKILTTDLYDENLWELVSSTARIGPQITLETSLRAQYGKLLERPMGSPYRFPSLEDIKFNVAQLATMPTNMEPEVSVRVTIGKQAKKPLVIENPMMIAPMAYGSALSKKVKIALAKGSAMAGTATNSGGGPFLQEERDAAKYLIFQYHRGDWGIKPEFIKQADAIEIQLGQGAYAGVGYMIKNQLLDEELRKAYGISKGQDILSESRQFEVQCPGDLKGLIDKLRKMTDGVPVGVKIAAGKQLEADLYWICKSGADFVVVDGAESATKGSPPILQDDFGIPTVFAVYRAAQWLNKNGYKEKVSLIAAGKIRTPGDVLKVCALGADACCIGAIALVAVSHPFITKALPYEPPTAITWYESHYAKDFDIDIGAKALNNFLEACKLELIMGIRALGKTALSQVNTDDLVTNSELIAKGCNIPMSYEPYPFEP